MYPKTAVLNIFLWVLARISLKSFIAGIVRSMTILEPARERRQKGRILIFALQVTKYLCPFYTNRFVKYLVKFPPASCHLENFSHRFSTRPTKLTSSAKPTLITLIISSRIIFFDKHLVDRRRRRPCPQCGGHLLLQRQTLLANSQPPSIGQGLHDGRLCRWPGSRVWGEQS